MGVESHVGMGLMVELCSISDGSVTAHSLRSDACVYRGMLSELGGAAVLAIGV